jgi:hypothetical protein
VNYWTKASVMIGTIVWVAVWISRSSSAGLIESLLLLAILVFTPICIRLAETPDRSGHNTLIYRLAKILQPFAATCVAVAFLLPAGKHAAILTLPWLLLTVLLALFGLYRLLPRGLAPVEEVAIDAGLIYILVGGVWLLLSRLGSRPLGFSSTIVLLTALHFHYSGFAVPILVGVTGRQIMRSDPASGRLFRILAVGVVTGTPLLAAGITFSSALEAIAALLLAGSLLMLSFVIVFDLVPNIGTRVARVLLGVSGASCAIAMLLAVIYGSGAVARARVLDISTMARTHGLLNALGFVLPGLLAWSILNPGSKFHPGLPFSRLESRFRVGPDFFERIGGVLAGGRSPSGLVDNLSEYRRIDFDPDRVHPAVRAFYEDTAHHELIVSAEWRRGFRSAAHIYKRLASVIGQMDFPAPRESALSISSRILPIRDELDGRSNVRAWIRTYSDSGSAVYVAAYATHSVDDEAYMNIAFPLPGGNLSSILRIENLDPNGVLLTTLPSVKGVGDQGVYFANRLVPLRLPFNETIRVWPAVHASTVLPKHIEVPPGTSVIAQHDVWLVGVNFLTLNYCIFPRLA